MPRKTGTGRTRSARAEPENSPFATPEVSERVKALVAATAEQMLRDEMPVLSTDDQAWLGRDPTLFPLLLQVTLGAARARERVGEHGDLLLEASCWLLRSKLEALRINMEAGHEWAGLLLESYQQVLVEFGKDGTLDAVGWNAMAELLQGAKIPVRPEMARALAAARPGCAKDDPTAGPSPEPISPEAMMDQLHELADRMADDADDPFEIVEGLAEIGPTMPPEFRVMLMHAFADASRQVARETLPLCLLDAEPALRAAAALALERIARPETFSPVMLRRAMLVRDWVPLAERDAIDRAIRKAEDQGIACAPPQDPPRKLPSGSGGPILWCSMIDGGGAQSVILAGSGRGKGLFASLLLKQGYGVRDALFLAAAPRRHIDQSLTHLRRKVPMAPIGREALDILAGHFIALGVQAGHPPPPATIAVAEALDASDWKDRSLDPVAEAARLFESLEAPLRTKPAVDQALRRAADWIGDHAGMRSWFVDDPALRAVAAAPGLKPAAALQRVLQDVLPPLRAIWTERALVMALWLRAGGETARQYGSWRDCAVLAHVLAAGRKMEDITAMAAIGRRSLRAARSMPAG